LRCKDCELIQFSPDWIGSPELYEALQRFPWYYEKSKSEFQIAQKLVKPGDSILEVGCANGNFRMHLPEAIDYSGLEFNQKAIDIARSRGINVYKKSLGEFAANHAGRFDSVFAFQVLEHVSQPRQFLLDMMNVAKPGGMVVFSVPSEDSFLREEVNNITNFPPHHATRWPDSTFQRLSQLIGGELIDVVHEDLSSNHRRAYANAMIWRMITGTLQIGKNGISPAASSKFFRNAIALAALPIKIWTVLSPKSPRGHTVTVSIRKI
jgi:2-polyprenyl-3-methyl-5-hydroxy-6-metoxy-1,4-benzoquinol methylase